jgi:hypothetical protein
MISKLISANEAYGHHAGNPSVDASGLRRKNGFNLPANPLAGGKDFFPPRLQGAKAPKVLSFISWRIRALAFNFGNPYTALWNLWPPFLGIA